MPDNTEGPRGPETGERYLTWFENITVAGREGHAGMLDPSKLNKVLEPGLDVALLPNISGVKNRLKNIRSARNRLQELILQSDAVIVRLPTELGLEAAMLAFQASKPLALDVAGCVLDGLREHGSLQGRIYAAVAFSRMRRVVAKADWVSFVTEKFLQTRYPTKYMATTVACSNVEIPSVEETILERRLARIGSGNPLVFGTIGSLYGKFKGIQYALEALSRAANALPPFTYRVLGGGDAAPWESMARTLGLQDRVVFDGTLPAGEEVRRWLDTVDVYLQPSLREGLPRALIEAMSRGCPALASDIAGIPELLPREFLHQPRDVARLSRQITELANLNLQSNCAQRNFMISRRYSSDVLHKTRSAFWSAFRDSVTSRASRY